MTQPRNTFLHARKSLDAFGLSVPDALLTAHLPKCCTPPLYFGIDLIVSNAGHTNPFSAPFSSL